MAETLRDLVVSLSLDSDNFSANLRSINAQLREADSQFKAAGAGVQGFENTTAGAEAKLNTLQQKLQLQQQAVQQYERALEQAKSKLQNSVDAHDKLAAKLEEAKSKHQTLGEQVNQLSQKLEAARNAGQENTAEYAQMEAELEKLKQEYEQSGQSVEKLEQQLQRSEAAMQRNADGVTRASTNLNNARAAASATEGEIDRLTQRLQKMKDGWLQAADKMAAFGAKATEVGKKIEGVGKQMSKISAVAIGAGTAAVTTFASYDDAIRQVYATMGLSASENAAEMEALTNAAQEMGASTRYSASEAASALNYLALAGYDSEQAIAALPTVLGLAQAGGIDLASASDMVTDSMSALGLTMDQMPGFADQMAKTAQKSNTSVAQLGEGILKVSATGKNLKGGTVELNTALGILADNGIKGAEGGTHLRNVILSLQNPTSAAAKQLEAMGVQVYDAQGNMRGLNEILGDLDSSMAGWTQSAKDAALSAIFNKTDLAAVNALLSNCGDRWNELSGEISDCEGTAADMAETMEGGIGGAFRSLKSAIEGLAIAFGDTLAPTIKSIAEKITEAVRKFTNLDDGTKQMIVRIGALIAVAGPLILVIGKLITGFGKTVTAISSVMKVMSSLGSATSLMSMGWVGLAIAIVAGVAALVKFTVEAYEASRASTHLKNAVEDLKEAGFKGIFEGVDENALSAFGLSEDNFARAETETTSWFDRLMETWTDGKNETNEIVSSFVDEFTAGTDSVRTMISNQSSLLEGYGVLDEETLAQMETDTQTLNDIDAEVAGLLKKRQNGYISADEQARLEELLDLRQEISERWGGANAGAAGYDSIQQQLDADIEMAHALEESLDPSKYGQALAALGQGYQAVCDSINANYQEQYDLIMQIQDEDARNAALAALNAQYTQDMADAAEEYRQNLAETAATTVSNNGLTDSITDLNELSDTLEVIRQTAGDQTEASIEAVAGWVSGMADGGMEKLQSLYSLIMQMQAAGMENTDIAASLGISEDDLNGILTTIQSIKQIADGTDSLSGLSELFDTMDENAADAITLTLGIDSEEAATQIQSFIDGYADTSVNIKVALDNITGDAITAWNAANSDVELTGPMATVGVQLGDDAASTIQTAWNANKLAVYGANGLPVEVTPEVLSMITANDVCAYDEDGTLHVIITPEVGTTDYVDYANNASEQGQTGLFGINIGSTTDQVDKIKEDVKAYDEAMTEYEAATQRASDATDFTTKDVESTAAAGWLEAAGTHMNELSDDVAELTDADLDNIAQQIMAIYAALQNPDIDVSTKTDLEAQLQELLGVVDAINANESGSFLSEGIAEGMVAYGWSGDASTLATNISGAVNSALGIASPSTMMKPTGQFVAAGVGAGMSEYSFAGDTATVASGILSSFSGVPGQMTSIGLNMMSGLASGIRSGRSAVVSAMVQAVKDAIAQAKAAAAIKSPSRVMRDEVGTMLMKGMGIGISKEAKSAAKAMANATKYTIDSAKTSVVGNTTNNKTYNQQSNVTLNVDGLSVRSDADVRSLAIEIAALTKRKNALHGC